jgi:hypothetical protein
MKSPRLGGQDDFFLCPFHGTVRPFRRHITDRSLGVSRRKTSVTHFFRI